mmetsp:Transcript_37665/g.88081  ORF Transcript_37665/g.88081 Transcript_37665/m.88081 type:complete len:224 (+) Transcript_37665:281-952(+)
MHPTAPLAEDLVATPIEVVGLDRVGRHLAVEVARLDTHVGAVRQLLHKRDKSGQIRYALAVQLNHPVLGHQLVLVRWGAEEVVRDVHTALGWLKAALTHRAVRLLQDESTPHGDVHGGVRCDAARLHVEPPLNAVAEQSQLHRRPPQHRRFDRHESVDWLGVHCKENIALEQLSMRGAARQEPLHAEHLPFAAAWLAAQPGEGFHPVPREAQPRPLCRAARHR